MASFSYPKGCNSLAEILIVPVLFYACIHLLGVAPKQKGIVQPGFTIGHTTPFATIAQWRTVCSFGGDRGDLNGIARELMLQ